MGPCLSPYFTGSAELSPPLLRFPTLHDAAFTHHPSNAHFPPFFFLVIWQGDPIPEDIYEILGGSSVRSISDLQRALRIDSVGKSPLHQTLLSISLALWGEGREQSIFQQAHSQQTPLSMQ